MAARSLYQPGMQSAAEELRHLAQSRPSVVPPCSAEPQPVCRGNGAAGQAPTLPKTRQPRGDSNATAGLGRDNETPSPPATPTVLMSIKNGYFHVKFRTRGFLLEAQFN